MKIKNKPVAFMLGWIFGTLSMLFMPMLALLGYEYEFSIEKKSK